MTDRDGAEPLAQAHSFSCHQAPAAQLSCDTPVDGPQHSI